MNCVYRLLAILFIPLLVRYKITDLRFWSYCPPLTSCFQHLSSGSNRASDFVLDGLVVCVSAGFSEEEMISEKVLHIKDETESRRRLFRRRLYNSWKRLDMMWLWLLEGREIHSVAFNHFGYCREHNIGTGYLLNNVFFDKMWDIENTLFLRRVLQFLITLSIKMYMLCSNVKKH